MFYTGITRHHSIQTLFFLALASLQCSGHIHDIIYMNNKSLISLQSGCKIYLCEHTNAAYCAACLSCLFVPVSVAH